MSTPDDTEKFKRFYDHISSKHDPHGFQLYFAAQEVTGIKHLWEEFPYEDACGRFELAISSRPERVTGHIGTETRPKLLREAAVGNIAQWGKP